MQTLYKPVRRLAGPVAPLVFRLLSRLFPQALWQGAATRPEIALTFDDGPHREDTPQLLKVLDRHQVKASFFFVGNRIAGAQDLVRQVLRAGHQIALHGYRHRPFPFETSHILRAHLYLTQKILAETCGCSLHRFRDVRPPYGLFTPATLARLAEWGYRPVMWTVVPPHWLQPTPVSLREVTGQVSNGCLLVLHEGLPGLPVASLADEILHRLKAAGFSFVTVDQMWRSRDR